MYQYGAKWTGIDISEEQIKQRESWNGRLKACRGIGASLTDDEIHSWENEHLKLLSEIAPKEFDILHYVAIAELKVKK